jgi:hypothetical protein
MSNYPFFRSEKTQKGPGLQFQIRKLTPEEFEREQQETAEQIESDPATTHKPTAKSSEISPEAAAAFIARYEQKQAKDDRAALANELAEALKKARGLK